MDAIQFILEINFMLISYVTSALSCAVKKMKEKKSRLKDAQRIVWIWSA